MSCSLLSDIVVKLPTSMQYEWGRYANRQPVLPTLVEFNDWISEIAFSDQLTHALRGNLETAQVGPHDRPRVMKPKLSGTRPLCFSTQETRAVTSETCPLCKINHRLSSCPSFKSMNLVDRVK